MVGKARTGDGAPHSQACEPRCQTAQSNNGGNCEKDTSWAKGRCPTPLFFHGFNRIN